MGGWGWGGWGAWVGKVRWGGVHVGLDGVGEVGRWGEVGEFSGIICRWGNKHPCGFGWGGVGGVCVRLGRCV